MRSPRQSIGLQYLGKRTIGIIRADGSTPRYTQTFSLARHSMGCSKLQAKDCNTRPLAAGSLLLIHALQTYTAKECQLNPDLIEKLLKHGDDPLNRWEIDRKSFSAWRALLRHEAGSDPPDLRWDRWKRIAAMFVKHIHSLEQISEVENLLGRARSISRLSVSFVQQQLKERAEQLVIIESPIQSAGRMPPEQPSPGAKRQKTNLGCGISRLLN